MAVEIKNRFTDEVICTGETFAEAVKANLANLRGANLLRRAAGDDIAKLKVAGLLLVCREKCWSEFAGMAKRDPLGDWALDSLAEWAAEGDGAPEIVRSRVKVAAPPAVAEAATAV